MTLQFTVTLSREAYLPPKDEKGVYLNPDTEEHKKIIKAAKNNVSGLFQEDQKRAPNHVTLTREELAARIKAGFCMRGALLEKMNEKNSEINPKTGKPQYNTDKAFIRQGAILLDFDNKTEPPNPLLDTADGVRELVNKAIGQNAVSIVSESWTSTPELRKWHIVLLLAKPCDDLQRTRNVIKYFVNTLFAGIADKACKEPARYVLGSVPHKITQVYDGILDLERLPAQAFQAAKPEPAAPITQTITQPNTVTPSSRSETKYPEPLVTDERKDNERLAEIILSSPCYFGMGEDGYDSYRNCCGVLYHIAGVSSDRIAAWGSGYDGTVQDPRTWENLTQIGAGGEITRKTLVYWAERLNPTAFRSYIDELSAEQAARLGKYKPHHNTPTPQTPPQDASPEKARLISKPDNTADYLTTKFFEEISQFQERGDIPTGFKGYDNRYRGLFAGVYIMAAVSSLGKTTFVHQLGENLATQGNHVIYFSTEQNRLELVSKSIARRSASADYTKGASSTDIRTGRFIPSNMKELVNGYIYDVGDRYSIIYTGISGLTPAYVREYVENYMNANKVKPIVIIDYLQVMRPDDEKLYSDRKRALDDSFHKLIALAKEHTLTVIVISSINRSSYLSPIDFESFKESGELEFGADVVLGLQLECMNDELFTMNNKLIDKRKKVKEAKTAIPRHVELVTLKDRYNGLRDTDGGVYFDYYPQFDLFVDGHKHTPTPTPTSSEVESEYEFEDDDERL